MAEMKLCAHCGERNQTGTGAPGSWRYGRCPVCGEMDGRPIVPPPLEREEAEALAQRVLDRPYADPDDGLAILARQVVRLRERDEALGKNLDAIVEVCAMAGIGSHGQTALRRVKDLHAALGHQIERGDKLQAFKEWVHAYLDARGVPHHPPGTHGAEGCRIGDRMDWLMKRLEDAEAQVVRLRKAAHAAAESLDQMAHDEVRHGATPRGSDCGLIARRLRAALAGEDA